MLNHYLSAKLNYEIKESKTQNSKRHFFPGLLCLLYSTSDHSTGEFHFNNQHFFWNTFYRVLPETASVWPLNIHITVAGGGMTWHTDKEPSTDEQATRLLSSFANFTLVTEMYKTHKKWRKVISKCVLGKQTCTCWTVLYCHRVQKN